MTFCPNWKSPDTVRIMNKILTSLGSYSLGQDDINLLITDPQAFEESHSIAYMEAIYKAYNIWSDTQGDEGLIDKAFNPTKYQKSPINKDLIATEQSIRDLASRLVDRIGGTVTYESDLTKDYSGYSKGNEFVINLAKATLDTPIHEILGHPIINAIKQNPQQTELYNNLIKELEFGYGKIVLSKVKLNYKNLSFEEQQEEAIVQLLGELTAGKIKETQENKNLISKLKQLLKEMTDYLRSLFNAKEINISDLKADMTLNDLANLLAYTNSKLILPGNNVEYTTPDNKKFKTYQEASKHISDLVNSVEDVNLDNIKLTFNAPFDFYKKVESLEEIKQRLKAIKINRFKNSKGENISYDKINGVFVIKFPKSKDLKLETKTEPIIVSNENEIIEAFNFYITTSTYKVFVNSNTYTGINDFVEKNKEFEQSKEIIEEWKKVNNIQYNPEEVYSKGQGFYSIAGAFADFDLELMLQNLLLHIEDNKKAGGQFTISATTDIPDHSKSKHTLVNRNYGKNIYYKIYPKSKDILWATSQDCKSGSVVDAAKKVGSKLGKELTGVSYTKYPSLDSVSFVQSSLTEMIDNTSTNRKFFNYNELGINLTENNFRLEYDADVPYSTKKIIDNINRILDQKYGKLIQPEINTDNKTEQNIKSIQTENNIISIDSIANKLTELQDEKLTELEKLEAQFEEDKQELRILKLQLDNNSIYFKNERYYKKYFAGQGHKYFVVSELEETTEITKENFEEKIQILSNEIEEKERLLNTEFEVKKKKLDDEFKIKEKSIYDKEYFTEQALINTKILALKEAAKKYPRSLIRSEVVNNFTFEEKPTKPNIQLGGTPTQLEVYNQVTELLGPDIPVHFTQELIDGVGVIAFDKSLGLILSDSVSPVNGEAYHEAFEIVWNTLLDNETKADLLATLRASANYNSSFANSIKEEYPELSNTGKDKEVLAELFREYMVTGDVISISMPTSMFDRILALIKKVAKAFGYSGSGQKNSEQNPIEKLFQDIKNKKYQYNPLATANMDSSRVYMKQALQNPVNIDEQGEPLIITTTQVKEYVDLVSATLSDIMVIKGDISITEVMNDPNILDEVYGKATKKIYDLGNNQDNLHTRLLVTGTDDDGYIITAEGGIDKDNNWVTDPNWQDTDFYKVIKPAFENYWKQYGINFKTKYIQVEETVSNQSEISEDGLSTQDIDDVDGNTNNTDYTVSKEVSIYDRTASEFSVMDSVSKDTFALLGMLTHNPEFIEGKSDEELRRLGIINNFGTASLIPISTSVGYLLNTLKDLSYEDMLYKLVNKAQLISGIINDTVENYKDLVTEEDLATLEYDKLYNTWVYSLVNRILPIELTEPITKAELSYQLATSNNWTQSKVTSMNGLMMAFNRVYLDHFIAVAGLDGSYRVFSSNQDTKEGRLKEKLESYQLANDTLTVFKQREVAGVKEDIKVLDIALIDKLAAFTSKEETKANVLKFLILLGIEETAAIKISENIEDRGLVFKAIQYLSNQYDTNKKNPKTAKAQDTALQQNPSVLYALDYLEYGGRLKTLLTALSKYIPDNNELQFRGLNGKNQYPITEFTLFAEYISGLNQAKTRKEYENINPLAKSIYANSSLILDSIFDEDGNRKKGMYIRYIAADGNKVEGEVGEALKKVGTPDKLMFEFHATVLKNTYTLLQTSDKSTVLGMQLTEPLWKNHTIIINADKQIDKSFIFSNKSLVDTYVNYLKDEYNLIADYHDNNEYKQYSNYSKFGGKLRFFNGVVSKNFESALITAAKKGDSFKEFFDSDVDVRKDFNNSLLNYFNELLAKELAEINDNGLTKIHPLREFAEALDAKDLNSNAYNTYVGISRELLEKFGNKQDNSNSNLSSMLDKAVLYYAINKQLAYIEQTKLFSGDLAFMNLAKQNEVFKRLPFLAATIRKAQNQTWLNSMFDNNANFLDLRTNKVKLSEANPTITNIGWRSDRYKKDGTYVSKPFVERGKVTRWYINDIVLGQNENSAIRQNVYNSGLLYAKLQGMSGQKAVDVAKDMASNYSEVTENDAQTYMSLDEYREFGIRTGQWNNFLEKAYWFQMNGAADNKYSDFNVSAFYNYPIYFTVVKPFGRGHQFIGEETGITIPQMDKQSIFPLVPSVIKGTKLELLAKFMQEKGIGHVLPPSATKTEVHLLSNGQNQNLYDVLDKYEKGENIEEMVMDSVPYDTYGIQVRTENTVKDKTRDGTQKKKLTMSDLYEFGQVFHKFNNSEEITNLLEDYNNSYDAIFDYQYKQLAGGLGISSTEGMSISKSTLVDRLYQSVLSSSNTGVADNVIESLKSIASLESIDHLNTRAKIESMISSIIDDKLINNKALGEGYIQVAVTGWEENKPRNFETDRTLKFYELIEKSNGSMRVLPMQTMIPLPKELMAYVKAKYGSNKEQLIIMLGAFNKDVARIVELYRQPDFDENSLSEDDRILNNVLLLTGYRIPTQALNSIEFLQVTKFLHPYTNAIVLPSEITAKSGGDFDFDKMPVLRKGVKYSKETGKLELASKEDDFKQHHFNNIIDISIKLLALPQNFDRLITPDGSDLLKDIAEDIVKAKTGKSRAELWKETPYNSLFTAHYNNYVADINWVSKDLVGIGATNITHHVHAQLGNYFLFPYIKKPITEYKAGKLKKKNPNLVLDLGRLYFYEKIAYTTIFPHNTTKYEGKEMISIAGVFDKAGENRISKVLGQSVTAFVDGAKDPLAYMLNLNSKTSGPFYQNIRQGNSLRTTLLYLSQPIIQELVKLQTINEAGFMKVADKAFGQMITDKVIFNNISTKDAKDRYNMLRPIRPNSELVSKLLLDYSNSKDKSKPDINDATLLSALSFRDANLQREILKQYLLDIDMAKELRNAAGVINIDTNGVGGSHAGVNARNNLKTMVQNVPHIFGVHNTLDPNQNFIGTMDKANNIAQGVFGALSIVPKSVFDYLYYKYPQIGEENTVKLFHLIKNDYISFLLQQHILNNSTVGKEGLKNLKGGKDNAPVIVRLLAQKKALIESDAEVFADNKFLKEITMVAKTKIKGSDNDIIKMWGRMMKVDEVNRLLDDFETFYNYNDTTKELTKELLTALLVQSGLNKSPINFIDKIPYNIFEEVFDLENIIQQVKDGGLEVQVEGNNVTLSNEQLSMAFINMFNTTNKTHPLIKSKQTMFVDNNENDEQGFKVKTTPYWLLNKYFSPITKRMLESKKVLEFNNSNENYSTFFGSEFMKEKATEMLASELGITQTQDTDNNLENRLATETEEELNNSYNEVMENEATDDLSQVNENFEKDCPPF